MNATKGTEHLPSDDIGCVGRIGPWLRVPASDNRLATEILHSGSTTKERSIAKLGRAYCRR